MATRRSGLGRGLESLISEAGNEASLRAGVEEVSIKSLKANPNQPRKNFDQEALDELAASIQEKGIIQPIIVRKQDESYEIVAGERRYQAALQAGLTTVPVVVREISDDEVFQIALIENLQRTDLNPIEEARGYKQLIESNGLTQSELSKVLSKSRPAIANAMRLLELPDDIQQLMADGSLSAGHARALLSAGSTDNQRKLASKIVSEGLSVRAAESLAPLYAMGNEQRAVKAPTPSAFKLAARRLRKKLGTSVRVRTVRNRNKIEIEFADEEDLARILAALDNN